MAWPRTIRFRYTLRALLVFLTLFALWGGYHANRAIRERRAEKVLARRYASFMYGPKKSGSGWRSSVVFIYESLVQLLWRERFISYVSVSAPLDQEVLNALGTLPYLEEVILEPRRMTETERAEFFTNPRSVARVNLPAGALATILGRPKLTKLGMSLWILSDDDCKVIAAHPGLEWLSIDGSVVTEEGLADIAALPSLRHMSFRWCNVSGRNLAGIAGSNVLEIIECEESPVGPEFAAFVRRSPKVAQLLISSSTINDEFVSRVSDHPALSTIWLASSTVTDSCVPDLLRWKSLTAVTFPRDALSPEAIDRLKKGRPALKISVQ